METSFSIFLEVTFFMKFAVGLEFNSRVCVLWKTHAMFILVKFNKSSCSKCKRVIYK